MMVDGDGGNKAEAQDENPVQKVATEEAANGTKPHGASAVALFAIVIAALLFVSWQSILDIFYSGSNYITVLLLYTGALFSFTFYFTVKLKPYSKASVKQLDYWYYSIAAIGIIAFASQHDEERSKVELKYFADPIAIYNVNDYPRITKLCMTDAYKEDRICRSFKSYKEIYASNDAAKLESLAAEWSLLNRQLFIIDKIRIFLFEKDEVKSIIIDFDKDVTKLYYNAENKYFTLSRSDVKNSILSNALTIFAWPFILLIAISTKLAKTLIEHKGWTI